MKFFPYKQTNGILRYFFDHQRAFYNGILSIDSQILNGTYEQNNVHNAFDFNKNTYWIQDINAEEKINWISFCLNYYPVKITHYEISTTNMGNRPVNWTFSVSNDGKTFVNEQVSYHPMETGEIYPVSYRTSEAYHCFKYTHTGITEQGGYRSDIVQFEIFGSVLNLNGCTFVNTLKMKPIFILIFTLF